MKTFADWVTDFTQLYRVNTTLDGRDYDPTAAVNPAMLRRVLAKLLSDADGAAGAPSIYILSWHSDSGVPMLAFFGPDKMVDAARYAHNVGFQTVIIDEVPKGQR